MKLTNSILAFLGMGLVTCGCAGPVKKLGSVGLRDYYSVRDHSFSGPNITKMVSIDRYHPEDERDEALGHGPGIGQALAGVPASAVYGVAGAAVFGANLRPSTTRVQSGNLHNETFAQGGEAIIGR